MENQPLLFPSPVPSSAEWESGVQLELAGDTARAEKTYRRILRNSECTRSAINLGTILYNRRQFVAAEKLYRRATLADPSYPLAFFNLGNALDDLGRGDESLEAYRTALRLDPEYADVHYNLAVALHKANEFGQSTKHLRAYLKADQSSKYANHARFMLRNVLRASGLRIV